MLEPLRGALLSIRTMMQSADIDYAILTAEKIDVVWFSDYAKQRVVNSFLFNYLKIQDRIGSKLFRLVLQHLREDETDGMSMLDMLNRLEKLRIIEGVEAWDTLREIRNAITHDYPEDSQTRIDTIQLALAAYPKLKVIVDNIERSLASYA